MYIDIANNIIITQCTLCMVLLFVLTFRCSALVDDKHIHIHAGIIPPALCLVYYTLCFVKMDRYEKKGGHEKNFPMISIITHSTTFKLIILFKSDAFTLKVGLGVKECKVWNCINAHG